MPWFSPITGALGEENPYDAIANWSNETQRRNRAAIGLDQNGNPIPQATDAQGNPVAPAAADPNNPVNNGQSAATGQALGGGVQQPGQQPNATKTDPSLGALLMNLTQYQQREQGFNQAMGAGFAAVSQPRDREWVSHIFNVNEPDPMKIAQQEQDLASPQQGQDRMNALGQQINGPQGAQIAQKLNITQAELIARYRADPVGVGQMIQNMATPTDQVKNYTQGRAAYIAAGHTKEEADIAFPPEFLTLAPGASLEDKQYVVMAAQLRSKGLPVPTLQQWQNDQALQGKLKADVANDHLQANQALPAVENKLNNAEQLLSQIQNDPNLPSLMKKWTPNTGIWSIGSMTDGERALAQMISNLSSDRYVQGFNTPGLGSRKTQYELDQIAKSMSGTLNANNLSVTDFKAGLQRLRDDMYNAHADAYGEAGDFSGLDPRYYGHINDAYRTGPLASTLSTPAPTRAKPTQAQKDWFNSQIKAGQPRDELITHLRYDNVDTSGF